VQIFQRNKQEFTSAAADVSARHQGRILYQQCRQQIKKKAKRVPGKAPKLKKTI
jgi:hypothetical protein